MSCEFCERDIETQFHHLIPHTLHRTKWYKKTFTKEEMQTRGLQLCKYCHKHIHESYTEKDLGRIYNTKEILLEQEQISEHIEWCKRQKRSK